MILSSPTHITNKQQGFNNLKCILHQYWRNTVMCNLYYRNSTWMLLYIIYNPFYRTVLVIMYIVSNPFYRDHTWILQYIISNPYYRTVQRHCSIKALLYLATLSSHSCREMFESHWAHRQLPNTSVTLLSEGICYGWQCSSGCALIRVSNPTRQYSGGSLGRVMASQSPGRKLRSRGECERAPPGREVDKNDMAA